MAAILGKAWQAYQILFEEFPDPRTKDWVLVAKPYQIVTLLGLYLMFVLKWGPKYMKNRQPYNLDKLLIVYNAAQVVACMYLFIEALRTAWLWNYKWICEPIDFSNNKNSMGIANLVYFYYLLKIIDLLDTVFFVLRKKFNQISFLHIYHHSGMCLLIWGAATYLPGGHGTLIGVINSFVHVVMYSYYLLTVVMPSVKNAVWIKKHVTQLQILQFFWCVVHMAIIVFKTDCEYPRWTSAVFLPQNLFMLILFIDFYIKTYIKKPRQDQAQKNTIQVSNQNTDNGDVPNNVKYENGVNKLNNKEINGDKNYQKNDLSKLVNGNNVSQTNGHQFSDNGNGNYYEDGIGKSGSSPDKCKTNGHKQFKDE